jgi:hypothetical protein
VSVATAAPKTGCQAAAAQRALLPTTNQALSSVSPGAHETILWCNRTEYATRVVTPRKHLTETYLYRFNRIFEIKLTVMHGSHITHVYCGNGTVPLGPEWPYKQTCPG